MPAATSLHSTSRTGSHRVQTTSHPLPPAKKTRTVRRRGRGKDAFESDEELVREVGTDSESDDDDHSSVDSSSDSDTEPASEDVLSNGHSHILTPNTTQSSADGPSLTKNGPKSMKALDGRRAPFFSDSGNWSEMVAEENAHGPAELPVIEFADLTGPSVDQRSAKAPPPRKPSKPAKRPPVKRVASAPTVDRPTVPLTTTSSDKPDDSQPDPGSDQPVASTSRQSSKNEYRRSAGQSARQAYQQRLETDPSYVPTVGEFWGHDDRLMDKDLRSLSGWWRGRWQGRGRGRGTFDRGFMRGRGRGGIYAGPAPHASQLDEGVASQEKSAAEMPRIDQPWTHDGFEEMKKRDEKKREAAPQQPSPRPSRGLTSLRGRGGFVAGRGRGGVAARGGAVPSPPSRPTAAAAAASTPGKIWYAMKPEMAWTKQLETFLFFDPALKPRPGVGPGYRVKLSSAEAHVIRVSARPAERPKEIRSTQPHIFEDGEKNFVVRLPKWAATEKVVHPPATSLPTVEEPHLEDVFTVRPELAPPRALIVDIKLPSSASVEPSRPDATSSASTLKPAESLASASTSTSPPLQPAQTSQSPPSQSAASLLDGVVHEHQETAVPTLLKADTPHIPESQDASGRRTLPSVPPLQTVFPPPQSSPPYTSPYGYGSPLPHGIAISQQGMAYEVATGRPVYLPAPIYTPRPLAHGMMTPPGMSYMHGHMHHQSTASPDFLSAPHTPPLNGFVDPATGNPIFAFPRQSSRVEIRAPSSHDAKLAKSQRRPSSLRTSAAAFDLPQPFSPTNQSHNALEGEAGAASEQHMDPAMYNYSTYPQGYYYPEQYGYSQYYDMSHMPQYEVYQTDPHASQPVYY